jgi:hypothetical protein
MSKDLTEALRVLTEQASGGAQPPAAMSDRGAASRATGSALLGGGSAKTGIASPLVEVAYAQRTFHAAQTITSTDGLLSLKIKPVKSINFVDASNSPVTIEFKSPS